jgi:hypothetical protein
MADAQTGVQTITIGNKTYEVDKLTDRVKRLVSVYQLWAQEAEKQQLEAAKTQAAIRDLTREIIATQVEDEGKAAAEAAIVGEPVTDAVN